MKLFWRILSLPLIALIKLYQWIISPAIGPKLPVHASFLLPLQLTLEALKKHRFLFKKGGRLCDQTDQPLVITFLGWTRDRLGAVNATL